MDITNKAYAIESGSTGIAFKSTPRYQNITEIQMNLKYFQVLLLNNKIIGSVKAQCNEKIVEIGSLAIDPDYQGKGYGSKLLAHVESLAPVSRLGCVSARTDLLPFYAKRGYKEVHRQFVSDLIASEPDLAFVTRGNLELITLQKHE